MFFSFSSYLVKHLTTIQMSMFGLSALTRVVYPPKHHVFYRLTHLMLTVDISLPFSSYFGGNFHPFRYLGAPVLKLSDLS